MTSKTLLLLFISATLLTASCKKDYTCTCCGGYTGGCSDVEVIKDQKKKDARILCNTNPMNGGQFFCDIK